MRTTTVVVFTLVNGSRPVTLVVELVLEMFFVGGQVPTHSVGFRMKKNCTTRPTTTAVVHVEEVSQLAC